MERVHFSPSITTEMACLKYFAEETTWNCKHFFFQQADCRWNFAIAITCHSTTAPHSVFSIFKCKRRLTRSRSRLKTIDSNFHLRTAHTHRVVACARIVPGRRTFEKEKVLTRMWSQNIHQQCNYSHLLCDGVIVCTHDKVNLIVIAWTSNVGHVSECVALRCR